MERMELVGDGGEPKSSLDVGQATGPSIGEPKRLGEGGDVEEAQQLASHALITGGRGDVEVRFGGDHEQAESGIDYHVGKKSGGRRAPGLERVGDDDIGG